jgi:hypothetical protein
MSLLNRIFHILGVDDVPDPAWKPTGYTCTAPGYDEAKGVAGAERSAALATSRRKLEALRSQPPTETR